VKKILVMGLGNPILSDDAVGILAARTLKESFHHPEVDIIEAELGGMNLLDPLQDYQAAIIMDSVITGEHPPGTIIFNYDLENLPGSPRLLSPHDADLASTIRLGKKLGMNMPTEVRILAMEVEDNITFAEKCTPKVKAAIPQMVHSVKNLILELLSIQGGQTLT
jgi:hydrogenase maturation protease